MSKFLIVNSDDFGMTDGVSRGIIEAHQRGIVTSTTTMMNMPAAEAAIKSAQSTAPELGLGVHFNLSFGEPLSPPESIPSLVTDEGRFVTSYDDLVKKMPTFDPADLTRELNAQFDRFCAIAGRLPTHLDSHHGVTHFHPAALEVMLTIANTHHLPVRWSSFVDIPAHLAPILEKHTIPRHPDYFVDFIFDFASTPRLERLKNGLRSVKEGYTELMVHVGYAEGLDEAYTFQREEELAAVTDASVCGIIEEQDIQLVNFADLPA